MKLNYLTKAAVVVALLSTLSGCWMFMPRVAAAVVTAVAGMVKAAVAVVAAARATDRQ